MFYVLVIVDGNSFRSSGFLRITNSLFYTGFLNVYGSLKDYRFLLHDGSQKLYIKRDA
jgi:hypothetical protein